MDLSLKKARVGIVGQAVSVDILNNDTPGDNPIDISSVQINGAPSAGSSLTVVGEGVWSINTGNGFISFAPEIQLP